MSGSYDALKVYSAPQGVYSDRPNAYSEAGQSVYDAIRNTHPPPPPDPGRYKSTSAAPAVVPYIIHKGPESAYAQASSSDLRGLALGPSGATDFSTPPLNPPSWPASGRGRIGAPPTISQRTMDERKISVSIDFGQSRAPDSLPKRS